MQSVMSGSGSFTPESQFSSLEDLRLMCCVCLNKSSIPWDFETELIIDDITVRMDSDCVSWVYCVHYHGQFHVDCIDPTTVKHDKNCICSTCLH